MCPELVLGPAALAQELLFSVKGTWKGFSQASVCCFRPAGGPLRPLSCSTCPSFRNSPGREKGLDTSVLILSTVLFC